MRIAIDARFLTHPQAGGFKTYTENLVAALCDLDRDVEYLLYLDRAPDFRTFLPRRNCAYRVVAGVCLPIREQFALRRQIERDDPDLVHFLCNTAPVNIQRPYVVTLHDTIQVTEPEPLRFSLRGLARWAMSAYSRWAIMRTIPGAAGIITVSDHEMLCIEDLFRFAPGSIRAIHSAPSPVFQPATPGVRRERRELLEAEMKLPLQFILGVGHEPRKNIPLLIEAFGELSITHRDLHLVLVVCDERRRAELGQMTRARKLDSRVLLLGSVSPDVLASLYSLARLFVFPSEREGFGLPPLEAMACGTPTIAMNRTSLPEVVGNGALLVDSEEPAAWADAIRTVLASEALRRDLSERGLARAAKFSWHRCAEETMSVYQSVCNNTGSRRAVK